MEIPVSKDIRKFKTKDIGNFSFKETAWIALAAGTAIVMYKVLKVSLDIAMIPTMIILAFGFFKPLGMTMTQFIRTVVKEDVLSPRTYINKTDFVYSPDEIRKNLGEDVYINEELWAEPEPTQEAPAKLSKEDSVFFAK